MQHRWILFVLLVAICVRGGGCRDVSPKLVTTVTHEHAAIVAPETDVMISQETMRKRGFVAVQTLYRSALPPAQIASYYDHELRRHGWTARKQRAISEWGKHFGGWAIEYCKGDFEAEVQYAGEAHNDWTYAFSVAWQASVSPCR
jgi:hypothetical protein